jgi:predicted ATPase
MNLEAFRLKLRQYRNATGFLQEELARELGLHPAVLSRKLNGNPNFKITQKEVKQIVLLLVQWGAIHSLDEAIELLNLMDLTQAVFSPEQWQEAPFNRLEKKPPGKRIEPATASPMVDKPLEIQPSIHNPTTNLIGRSCDIALVKAALLDEKHRLVTLTGAGGVGKTRLAQALAEELKPDFKDGVYFVSLETVRDAKNILVAVAYAFGIQDKGSIPLVEILKTQLNEKELLLIIDNFEHLISGAPVISSLLANAPALKILVTSRAVLRLYHEYEYSVAPLELPSTARAISLDELNTYPAAILLFCQRAKLAKPTFKLTLENAPAVVAICRSLDGLPLALELAAAWLKILSPQKLLEKLQNRLVMLTSGSQDMPNRQQTLRNTIEWSYKLLDKDERNLFAALGVFVGGADLEAVEAVCGEMFGNDTAKLLNSLARLVGNSILKTREDGEQANRFVMLETIREYALECLNQLDEADLRRKHAAYFTALVVKAQDYFKTPAAQEWMRRLETDLANFRRAMYWLLNNQKMEQYALLCNAIGKFFYVRGYLNEGLFWLSKVVFDDESVPPILRANVFYTAGCITVSQGDYAAGQRYVEHSLALRPEEDKVPRSLCFNMLGAIAQLVGRYERATEMFQQNLDLTRSIGDARGIFQALHNLAVVAKEQNDLDYAEKLFQEAYSIGNVLEDQTFANVILHNLGLLAFYKGDLVESQRLTEQSIEASRRFGSDLIVAHSCNTLGMIALEKEEIARSKELFLESLFLRQKIGEKRGMLWSFEGLAAVAGVEGEAVRAAKLYGATFSLRKKINIPLPPSDQVFYQKMLDYARCQTDELSWLEAWNEGSNLTFEETLNLALSPTKYVSVVPTPY